MSEPSFLPFPTDLIPAEELSGNLDPLGTLTHAEHLAEALLPGLTVRMWRGEAVSELMPWLSADAGKSKQMVAVAILQLVDYAMAGIERDNPALKGVLPKDYATPALDKQRLGQIIDARKMGRMVDRTQSELTGHSVLN